MVSGLSETLSPCYFFFKKEVYKIVFAAGVKQHEQQVVRQGQKWSSVGLGTAAVRPPVPGLKNEENPTKTHNSVKEFKVMPPSPQPVRSSSVTARNFHSSFGRGKGSQVPGAKSVCIWHGLMDRPSPQIRQGSPVFFWWFWSSLPSVYPPPQLFIKVGRQTLALGPRDAPPVVCLRLGLSLLVPDGLALCSRLRSQKSCAVGY